MAKAIQLEPCLAVIFSVWSSAKSSFYEDLCLQHVFVNQPKAHPIYAEELIYEFGVEYLIGWVR